VPVVNLLERWSLARKVVAMVVAGLVCLGAALLFTVGAELGRYAEHLAVDRQEANMRVAWRVLRSYGTSFQVNGGRLYAGAQPLNDFFAPVDEIKSLVGGTATVFMGDERIATNVLKPDGSRAVGTRLAPGPVYERVLKQGQPFRGEAAILGQPYFTAYDPIKGPDGRVLGVLYVGIPKAEFFAAVDALRRESALLTAVVTGLLVVLCLYGARRMFRPLNELRAVADRLSRGDHAAAVPFAARGDDLGRLAQALVTLRDASVEKARIEVAVAEQRRARELEQRVEQDHRAAAAEAQRLVVGSLATGLEHLSAGDLTFRIETPFAAEYEKLRTDFNAAMDTLADTLGAIATAADGIRAATAAMSSGAAELSERTQSQATSLESTVGTLGRVAAQVNEAASTADATRTTVDAARDRAQQSGAIVRSAIAAMSEIEGSSRQIQQIIGVIDEIAFQTNLLALNAAVEAARAGDQGRGFAVVAAEVRNLASRSSGAAKEIKGLILRSTEQVASGTALVGQTGQALERIVSQVNEITVMVRDITSSAVAQAGEIREVDSALGKLDSLTQQNAAMVEESTSASHAAAAAALQLMERIACFRIADALQAEAGATAFARRDARA
jgi:methyl-accepting chemotaxis protein